MPLFKEHPYHETPTGIFTGQGEPRLLVGTGDSAGGVRKTHRHLMIGIKAPNTLVAQDFEDQIEKMLPFSYQNNMVRRPPAPTVRESLQVLHMGPRYQQLELTPKMVEDFSAALGVAMPGFETQDTLSTLRDLFDRMGPDPRIAVFSLPSPSFCEVILALGGMVVDLDDRPLEVQAKEFVDSLEINGDWQIGEPPTYGSFEAKWSEEGPVVEVMFFPQNKEKASEWHLDSPRIPVFPPLAWRPLASEQDLKTWEDPNAV